MPEQPSAAGARLADRTGAPFVDAAVAIVVHAVAQLRARRAAHFHVRAIDGRHATIRGAGSAVAMACIGGGFVLDRRLLRVIGRTASSRRSERDEDGEGGLVDFDRLAERQR